MFPGACARRFEPIRQLGAGGQGAVWLARQRQLQRTVVVKLLHPDVARRPDDTARFTAEARVTALLRHPHVVGVIDHGVDDGQPWIAYEYLEGPTLREQLADGPLAWRDACRMGHQVASALEAAHARAILHRDIKPDNILVAAPGEYKVADFGVAKWSGSEVRTESGIILGTPAYLSPQQLRGLAPAFESDVYALGVTLFEALTGRLPFWDENLLLLLQRRLASQAPAASSFVAGLPPAVDRIVARSVAADREERFRDATQVREALEAVIAERPSTPALITQQVASRARPPPPNPRVSARRASAFSAASLVLVIVLAWSWKNARSPAPATGVTRPAPLRSVSASPIVPAGQAQPRDAREESGVDEVIRSVSSLREELGKLPREEILLALEAHRLPGLTESAIQCLAGVARLLVRGRNASWRGPVWLVLNEMLADTCLALHQLRVDASRLPALRLAVEQVRAWTTDPGADAYSVIVAQTAPAYVLYIDAASAPGFAGGRARLLRAERALEGLAGGDVEVMDARLRLLEDACKFISRENRSVAADLANPHRGDRAVREAQRPVRARQMEIARAILEKLPDPAPASLARFAARTLSVARQCADSYGDERDTVRQAVELANAACGRLAGVRDRTPHVDRWIHELASLARQHRLPPPCPSRDRPPHPSARER